MEEKHKEKANSLLFFGIPILLTLITAIIVIIFLDIPVWKSMQTWGNKVPGLNQIIPDRANSSDMEGKQDTSKLWEQRYADSQAEIQEKEQTIKELSEKLGSTQKDLDNLSKYNEDLQKQLETKQAKKVQEQMKQVTNIYKSMQPSKAAAILSQMSLEDASIIISQLSQSEQSSILASMKDLNKAGQITMILKEIAGMDETDPVALKGHLQAILQNQSNPLSTLTETVAAMPADQAAAIINSMMSSNSQLAMELVRNLSTANRSLILTEIAKKDAQLAAKITANLK